MESEKKRIRTTEKSQEGDQEVLARLEEKKREAAEGEKEKKGQHEKRGESSKFKQLMAARKIGRWAEKDSNEESDEDSEYDLEEDEEDSLGEKGGSKKGEKKEEAEPEEERDFWLEMNSEKTDEMKEDRMFSEVKTTSKPIESEEEEEDDGSETESEKKGNKSDASASSKKKGLSTGELRVNFF